MKSNITPIQKINSVRLKEARIARGYSQSKLGNLFGVSRQTISKYEEGCMSPKAEIFNKYVELLNFPLSYFYNSTLDYESSDTAILFRSLATASKMEREKLSIRAEWIKRIVRYFSQYLEFPEVIIKQQTINKDYSAEEIENLSKLLRQHWNLGLGPISNLTALLQNKGCFIARTKIKVSKSDGCSKWSENRPYIFLTADKNVAVRSRFDLAHELGHLILHHITEGMMNKELLKKIEKEANYFAGAFLLPRETFGNQIVSTSLDYFIQLKKEWKVSIAAMIYRCKELGILSENQTSYLWRQLAARCMKKNEPYDKEFIPEKPTLLHDAVEILLESGIVSAEEILQKIALPKEDFCELCNISSHVFDKNIKLYQPKLRLIK